MISYDHYTTASINKTVELGSFTKVARVLNMTQPAVSHAISSIESELELLFLYVINEKGSSLRMKQDSVHIREILNGVEKIEQEVAMEKGQRSWDDSNW